MTALILDNLTKIYPNQVKAVNGINLAIAEGDFFALLGRNGAGKSTTIGIISSLINKTAGQVNVFGYDLDRQPEQVKSCIGVVPQEFNFGMFERVEHTIIQQAGYYGIPASVAWPRAEKYLTALGLWEKRQQQIRHLSGGMKRRLLIVKALMHEPKLLILDEPTAGVDIELRRIIWDFLRTINQQGTTIILTTHYLEEAENLCKNIAIIDRGQIIVNTNMKDLLRRLDLEIFVLNLEKPLQQPPVLENFPCQWIDEMTLEVELHRQQSLNELFKQLSQQQISVSSLRNKTNRLETLFINLVENNKPDVK